MRNLFRIYLEKPELAGVALLVLLAALFEARSDGAFLSGDNLRGILGLLPEVGLVSIGVTILMICGEFDLSVGSTFALTPMATSLLIIAGVPAFVAIVCGLLIAAAIGFANGFITTSATTNTSGVATSSVFTANTVSGPYTVASASVGAGFTLALVTPVSGAPVAWQSIILLLAVILVAMLFIVVVVQIDLRRPLHRLDVAVAALGNGDFDDYFAFHLRQEKRRNHDSRYRSPGPLTT